MSLCLVVFLAGLGTYAIRLSFIAAHGRVGMPPWFARVLGFVPVAVLAALIAPDLFSVQGAPSLSPLNPRLVAGALAILLAWKTRSVWLTIALGMATLFVMQRVMTGGLP